MLQTRRMFLRAVGAAVGGFARAACAGPADLPIQQPSKFDQIIYMRTAKALGLTIPPSVLAQATELIQ